MPKLTIKKWQWDLPHVHAWMDRSATIRFTPKPLIGLDTRLLTIGSCFAAELAKAMRRLDLQGRMHPGGLFYWKDAETLIYVEDKQAVAACGASE